MMLERDGSLVTCGGRTWDAGFPVVDARVIADRVVVILDAMAFPRGRQAQNLRAFTFEGEPLWVAEHPTNGTADSYKAFMDKPGLVVWNFACYVCTLDPESGRLLEASFTK